MTKREFVTKSGDTFEWEETEEMRKAVEKLHQTIQNATERLKTFVNLKHPIME